MPALLLTELFPPAVGGSAVLFEQLYSRLPDIRVDVLTRRRPGGTAAARDVHVWPFGDAAWRWGALDGRAGLAHLARARRLLQLAGGARPVVHCGRVLPEGLTALLAQSVRQLPFVCWTHGEELAYIASSRELTFLAQRVHRAAAAVIANSRNTARLLEEAGVPAERIEVIYPAVDATRFGPHADRGGLRARYAPNGELLLLSVGRLQRRKGHDVALEALSLLRGLVPAINYVIAGDGEERSRLEAAVDGLGLRDCVSFAGAVRDDELPAYYAACDIFLLPNRVEHGDLEGFGIVFLEAAAAGRPVIGGRSGGVPEAVEDEVTGLLVDGAKVGAVTAAIGRLASSPALRASFGTAGRARVLREFTWDVSAARLADLHWRVSAGGNA